MGKLPANILRNAKKRQKLNDGAGLYLYSQGIDGAGFPRGSWVYRYTLYGKPIEYSIGAVSQLTLSQAREIHKELVMMVKREGRCPKTERDNERVEAQRKLSALTIGALAPLTLEAVQGRLKGERNVKQWYGPINNHILPALGHLAAEDVNQHDIVKAVAPLWKSKYPTAKKVMDRLRSIFEHAVALGVSVDMDAITHARILLGEPTHKTRHHPDLPVDEAARLYQSLDAKKPVERALMIYLLTGGGARIRPLREAHMDSVRNRVWYFDGDAMKGRKGKTDDFRLPVTDEMQRLLEIAAVDCVGGYFFSTKRGAQAGAKVPVVSDQSLENVMRDREREWHWAKPYRLHGIRGTFRTWVAKSFPHLYAVAETSLAHKVGHAIERTYQHYDFLEERRELLEAWNGRLTVAAVQAATVLPLKRGGGEL
jgi:integrase